MDILSDLDRYVFFECNRNALLNHIKELTDDEIMINYIKEDASDANILSLIMYGKVLKEDNIFVEQKLIDKYMTILEQNNIIDERESLLEGVTTDSYVLNAKWRKEDIDEAIKSLQKQSNQLIKINSRFSSKMHDNILKQIARLRDERSDISQHSIRNQFKDMVADTKKAIVTDDGIGVGLIGATLLIAATAMIGYKVYKRYFTVAGKTCAGKSGYNKEVCITNVKIKAIEETIKIYKDNMKNCKLTKDPNKCKERINKLIQKSQLKINTLKKKKMK